MVCTIKRQLSPDVAIFIVALSLSLPNDILARPEPMHSASGSSQFALALPSSSESLHTAFISSAVHHASGLPFRCPLQLGAKRVIGCAAAGSVRRPPKLTRLTPKLRMTASQDERTSQAATDSSFYDERDQSIQLMIYKLARLGGDLSALGPAGRDITGFQELFERVEALQREVEAAKDSSISSQLLDVEPDLRSAPFRVQEVGSLLTVWGVGSRKAKAGTLQLHVGCGKNTIEGWLNVDLHGWRLDEGGPSWKKNRAQQRVLSMNVASTPLPLPDRSCQVVYCSHMLEHLGHPVETQLFLSEVRRVLAPGGAVRIVVPDAEQWLSAYVNKDSTFFGAVQDAWSFWDWASLSTAAPLDFVLPYLGASGLRGSITGGHMFGFDAGSLAQLLVKAGFDRSAIRRCTYQGSPREALRVDNTSSAAAARWGSREAGASREERHFSLFMEAEKGAEAPSVRQRQGEQQGLNFLQRLLRKE